MERHIRHSEKRDAIYNALAADKSHPSAERLFTQLKPLFPDLSAGTVYRNLTRFKEEGTVVSVGVIAGQERFDADLSDHNHFICKECNSISDVTAPLTLSGISGIETDGRVLESCEIMFKGLCAECAAKLADN
jgi:Fur family peroxide stress response transcriptional regulator